MRTEARRDIPVAEVKTLKVKEPKLVSALTVRGKITADSAHHVPIIAATPPKTPEKTPVLGKHKLDDDAGWLSPYRHDDSEGPYRAAFSSSKKSKRHLADGW